MEPTSGVESGPSGGAAGAVESSHNSSSSPPIRVGVCTMDKKAKSKPMVQILTRLNKFGDFEIVEFGDTLILTQPIEAWPQVDCLIAFYSDGFPLDKAVEYVKLSQERNRNFLCLNDLQQQYVLLDRRLVYRTLSDDLFPVTKYIEVSRDGKEGEGEEGEDPEGFYETEDSVSMNGVTIHKPFVEKPVNGEDHNVWIYYPGGITGGGVKKLFRKIKNKSSEFYPDHPGDVRKEGSYIYERFMQTGGTDVKVYTVGPHYAHAEARKSPVVDGFVERFPDGKEIRYPVLLTPAEKEIAKKINIAFGQFACGFDLLRSQGKSYVCDVNGWSFVKNSEKYYKDAADIMRHHILHQLSPQRVASSSQTHVPASSVPISIGGKKHGEGTLSVSDHRGERSDDMHGSPNYFDLMHQNIPTFMRGERSSSYEDLLKPKNRWHKSRHELRAIIAVIRHGDRTPKQKMKVKVTQKPLLDLMKKCGGGYYDGKLKQAKLKRPEELQDLLNIIRQILHEHSSSEALGALGGLGSHSNQLDGCSDDEEREFLHRMKLARTILERGGKFSGINRKVQLKPLQVKFNHKGKSEGEGEIGAEGEGEVEVVEALMIIKHGGILTDQGKKQSEELGARFRKQMYPQVKGGVGDGLLRLHSTYRHDLKIYSSDEGRVQVSAAAFAKGLLDLEGNSLVPIMISLVNKDQQILDAFGKGVDETMQKVKIKLQCAITGGISKMILPKFAKEYSKSQTKSNTEVVTLAQSPIKPSKDVKKVEVECQATTTVKGLPPNSIEILEEIHMLLRSLCDDMLEKLNQNGIDYDEQEEDENQENSHVMDYERWKDLMHQFCKRGKYNISMITEIFDSAKYDLIQKSTHEQKKKKKKKSPGDDKDKDKDHDEEDGFIDFGLLKSVYQLSKKMADIVVPNEYGISGEERWDIGNRICSELLGKLCRDFSFMRQQSLEEELEIEALEEEDGLELEGHSTRITHRLAVEYAEDNQIKTPERHVRTRIYFTSESHIHALLNVLRYGPKSLISPMGLELLENCSEFDYLSQVLFRVFENFDELPEDPKRFTLEILFSPGSTGEPWKPISLGFIPCGELQSIGDGTLSELEELIFPYATHNRKENKLGSNQISFAKRQGL